MVKLISTLQRFIEIDYQYLKTPFPLIEKVLDIIRTDFRLISNLVLNKKKFSPVSIRGKKVYYDTPYGTKTLLTTFYDFFIATKRGTILPQKPVIVDIGANIGQFLIASKSFFPSATVYSFEPDAEVFAILNKNASNFEKVKVFDIGLSDRNSRATFYRSNEFSEWSGLKKIDGVTYDEISVKLSKGDDQLKGLTKIDLLKIDVEGAELEVLKGLKKLLSKSEYILIEISLMRNSNDIGSKDVIEFLSANNFHLLHIGRIFSEGLGKNQGAADFLFKRMI